MCNWRPAEAKCMMWSVSHPHARPAGHTETNPESGVYLFDLSADISESHNLASDPAHAAIVAHLQQRLREVSASGPPPAYVFTDAGHTVVGWQGNTVIADVGCCAVVRDCAV